MMDYVRLMEYLRNLNPELKTQPAFLFGGSYGGMLAAWIRMKYPNHFQGAIASSAPILWFRGATNPSAYTNLASSVFLKQGGLECFNGVKYGFYDLTNLKYDASKYSGIKTTFNLCDDIKKPEDIDTLIAYISDSLGTMAMVNYPYPTNFVANLPAWPMKVACDEVKKIPDIDETKKDSDPGVFKFNNLQKL
jgi:pimeloyl-ACP methyl ester carboxylesterase